MGYSVKHGLRRHALYKRWLGMRQRCNDPNHRGYKWYGAKGVKVCQRWDDFSIFLEDMGLPPLGATLDRIDNSKGYEPGNCRWASRKEQSENSSRLRLIEFDGKRMHLNKWASHLGISPRSLAARIRKWPLRLALTLNKQPNRGAKGNHGNV